MLDQERSARLTGLDTVQGALDTIETYFENGWTDGLPIVPPTESAVADCVAASGRDGSEVLGLMPPRMGVVTVEAAATNAVMAGCLPEYMPVVLAAVEAALDPVLDIRGLQATSDPAAPLIIVSGPVVEQVGINHGVGLFGHGSRANATIGRALRLMMINLGDGRPDTGDKSTMGSPSKYSYCMGAGRGHAVGADTHRFRIRCRRELRDRVRGQTDHGATTRRVRGAWSSRCGCWRIRCGT